METRLFFLTTIYNMASTVVTFFAVLLVSAYGDGVDSAHMQCELDHQCPNGYFCYEESHFCTLCLECVTYKRKPSWRSCPKTPSDCGGCVPGYEEEILHEGRTRDICIPSNPYPLSQVNHTTADNFNSVERYFWFVAVAAALLLPIMLYTRKNWRRDGGTSHHGLPNEEPPPYQSVELTTITNNSVERLTEDNLVLSVGQQKDCLVQAVPFRQPDYAESEPLAYENSQEVNSESVDSSMEDRMESPSAPSSADLYDENTMPSDWTPDENENNTQLMTFEPPEPEICSESEDGNEPASKRYKATSSEDDDGSCNNRFSINLVINNNVTINKPT